MRARANPNTYVRAVFPTDLRAVLISLPHILTDDTATAGLAGLQPYSVRTQGLANP